MTFYSKVEVFLHHYCPSSDPLLLALSGGADSLSLFYSLLIYRDRHGVPFHIAHVDHGWRKESHEEAEALQQLALQYQIPFYLKVLNPTLMKGNLEAACREERYNFFAEICEDKNFQGVLTGHHQDDLAETVFKRLLEGAHWSRWIGLKAEVKIKGIRILRPLLPFSKNEIREMLDRQHLKAFEDPSNHHLQFLRARLRKTIFPRLNQEFGKQVEQSLVTIGEEAQELVDYFEERLLPLVEKNVQGPWGIYLDLKTELPSHLIELKYLLRLICMKQGFFLSRFIIEKAAKALYENQSHQLFIMGSHHIWIDRRRIFIVSPLDENEAQIQEISPGHFLLGKWKVNVEESVYLPTDSFTSWKEGWKGYLRGYLPRGSCHLGFIKQYKNRASLLAIKKRWSQAKVPAFLSTYFPCIWTEEKIVHEFLTGRSLHCLEEGKMYWKVDLTCI